MTPMLSSALLRTQSDARLVALAGEGHERAFEAIVERYRRPLDRYLRRMLPAVRVEDVLQQTFMGAWASLREGAEIREPRPWLYRIAHNAGVNALKRSGYDYQELEDSLRGDDGPEGDVERRAVMRETLAAVAGLPERQRRALLETAVEGRPQADVAREMGMSDGAFRQLVHRARSTLRAAATAVTPLPMVSWAAAAGSSDAPAGIATRIAELTAGAGIAGVGATIAKTGAVVVTAGALATGPVGIVGGGSDRASGSRDGKAARSTTTRGGYQSDRPGAPGPDPSSSPGSSRGEDSGRSRRRGSSRDGRKGRRGRGSDDGDKRDDRSGRRDGENNDDARENRSSGSGSGSGSGGGGDSSGSSGSGSSGGLDSSESSGSGSSGSGSSGSGSSGSGSSGSGSSGSGSGDSGGGRSSSSGPSGSGDDSPDPDDG